MLWWNGPTQGPRPDTLREMQHNACEHALLWAVDNGKITRGEKRWLAYRRGNMRMRGSRLPIPRPPAAQPDDDVYDE